MQAVIIENRKTLIEKLKEKGLLTQAERDYLVHDLDIQLLKVVSICK